MIGRDGTGLAQTVVELDALRERLTAAELRAEWATGHGVVALIVPGPRMTVDGVPVPMGDRL